MQYNLLYVFIRFLLISYNLVRFVIKVNFIQLFLLNNLQKNLITKLLKHSTDLSKMFTFIDPLMMDTEREVHQGLGWFLRECWKRDRDTTEGFLLKWKNDCARLIIQYATEKMTKEERLQFRRDKK